jgi:hypothetical protein
MTDYYVQRKEDTKMGLFCKRKQQKWREWLKSDTKMKEVATSELGFFYFQNS